MKRALLALFALLTGLDVATAAQAQGETPSRSKRVPPSWSAYAQLVGRTLPAWLDEPSAASLRERLDAVRTAAPGGGYQLALKVWAAPDGKITRLEAPAAFDPAAEQGLQAVLVGRRLPAPPPADLRWPIRLLLKSAPPPDAAAARP